MPLLFFDKDGFGIKLSRKVDVLQNKPNYRFEKDI